MSGSKHQIPEKFNSVNDIQEFWEHHSTSDYWDKMKDIELKLSPQLKLKIELRKLYRILGFSPKQIAEIEAKATKENINGKQLIYKWVSEHI
ncbi:hypothetical protein JW964_10740 [candidate division KSB1 bacterium]|nr:hypothetical protein [candidate division KSB1 bacterium]